MIGWVVDLEMLQGHLVKLVELNEERAFCKESLKGAELKAR